MVTTVKSSRQKESSENKFVLYKNPVKHMWWFGFAVVFHCIWLGIFLALDVIFRGKKKKKNASCLIWKHEAQSLRYCKPKCVVVLHNLSNISHKDREKILSILLEISNSLHSWLEFSWMNFSKKVSNQQIPNIHVF